MRRSGFIYSLSQTGAFSTVYDNCQIVSYTDNVVQATTGKFYGTHTGEAAGGAFFSLDMGLGPFVTFVLPSGRPAQTAQILGQGLIGTTGVTFNGVAATSFKVVFRYLHDGRCAGGSDNRPGGCDHTSGPAQQQREL